MYKQNDHQYLRMSTREMLQPTGKTHDAVKAEIQSDVDEFIAKGGKIEVLSHGDTGNPVGKKTLLQKRTIARNKRRARGLW